MYQVPGAVHDDANMMSNEDIDKDVSDDNILTMVMVLVMTMMMRMVLKKWRVARGRRSGWDGDGGGRAEVGNYLSTTNHTLP